MSSRRGVDDLGAPAPRLRAHTGAAVLAAALAALGLTACAGSGRGSSEPPAATTGDAASTVRAREATTAAEARAQTDARPPLRRAEWRSRFRAWMDNVRPASTHVGLVASDARLRRQLRRNAEERDAFATSLAALAGCDRWVGELAPPPRPLARATRLAERACGHYVRAATLFDDSVSEPGRARAAARDLTVAARLLAEAGRALRRPELNALPLPVRGGRAAESRVEPLLTRVARSTRPMPERVSLGVRCWSRSDWPRLRKERALKPTVIGFVVSYSQTVNLAPKVCESLVRLAYGRDTGSRDEELDAAFAVGVLMHEAAHVYEEWLPKRLAGSEAVAECWAVQHVRPAALMLGASVGTAARLAERYWAEIYPYEHERYRSRGCRNGGFLDRRSRSDVWP